MTLLKRLRTVKRAVESMVPSLSVSNRITIKPIMATSGGSFSALQQFPSSRFEVTRLFLNLIR